MKKQSLLFLFLILTSFGFSQKRKQPPIVYKTIYDTKFAVGDRINLGNIPVIMLPLGKDSLNIPDSLDVYRAFVQRNELMTFKLHLLWKLQGVKYPGRTDRSRDALLEYFNEDGPDEDSTCYINSFKHSFVKQDSVLRIELEVIEIQSYNLDQIPTHGVINIPEQNILYRNYNNLIEVAVSEYKMAVLNAEARTEIVVESVEVKGPEHFMLKPGCKRIKTSVKGSEVIAKPVVYSQGCG